MLPLCIELYAGLHGWGEGFISEGFRVIGFDIVDMGAALGIPRPAGVSLVLQDVLTLHGSQFKNAAVIVCSPPCQAYSYRAMPWKRAKALPPPDNALFDACFRIQREAGEAAGRYIPLIVENVKGAQPWVGRARWHYGSFYLWGDVPALMPLTRASAKVPGLNWSGSDKPGYKAEAFNDTAAGRLRDDSKNRDCWKQPGLSGPAWFNEGAAARGGNPRKAASAMIAKIPFELARHIARVFKPAETERVA